MTVSAWQFGELATFGYDVIVAEPWDFESYSDAGTRRGADPHYSVMSLDDIKAMRVGDLARSDCLLLLWGTECMRPQAHETMAAWGFEYKSAMVWRKVTALGKSRMGTGYRVRTMHEPILLGTIGNPRQAGSFPSIFDGIAREHSRKPDENLQVSNEAHAERFSLRSVFARGARRLRGVGRRMRKIRKVKGTYVRILAEQPDPPTLRFGSQQDALDYARHSVEQSRREMMGNCWLPVVEGYVDGHCDLVLTLKPKGGVEYIQLVFGVIPPAENGRFSIHANVEREKGRVNRSGNKGEVLSLLAISLIAQRVLSPVL